MGQYFYIVNETKKQFLHPHAFDEGLKLAEFGSSSNGSLKALAFLLSDNDVHPWEHELNGTWAGDKITIAGDYGPDDRKDSEGKPCNLHHLACEEFEDISAKCRGMAEL